MKHRIPVLAAIVTCVLVAAPGPALAAETLDQYQTNTSQATAFAVPGLRLAQTFTAGMTGTLDRVDVYATGASVDLLLDGGGAILDGQTVTFNAGGWTTVTLATPPHVVKGAIYFLILEPPGPGNITWNGSDTNAYTGGQALILDLNFKNQWYTFPAYGLAKNGNSLGWSTQDFAFKTYISTPAAATPTPTPKPVKAPTPAPSASPTAAPSATDTATATDTPAASDTPIGTASAAASELAAAATAPSSTGLSAPPPSAPAGGSGDSGLPVVPIVIAVLVLALAGGGAYVLMRRGRT